MGKITVKVKMSEKKLKMTLKINNFIDELIDDSKMNMGST